MNYGILYFSHRSRPKGVDVETVGVIAFAFGQQVTETAGPSNEAIARVALDVMHEEQWKSNAAVLSTQWEVALYCDERAEPADFIVSHYDDPATHYIDTKGVFDASLGFFKSQGVRRVVLVAHPFHLLFIRLLIATKLWSIGEFQLDTTYNNSMASIPYDKSPGNRQKWTRGPVVFVAYLLKALLTKKHGN